MNKILIFAGAKESKLLIQKIVSSYLNIGEFHIIYEDEEIKDSFENKENLFFYKINFYSPVIYKKFIYSEFNKIIIFIKNAEAAKFVLDKIKFQKVPILFVKFWMEFEEIPKLNNIETLDIPQHISNKIIDFLPGVPLFARDIGLGNGEIMEVEIPVFSPFAYKSPSYIEERYGVKAAAIYRQNSLKMINKNTTILPNDKILLIGNPVTLKELYNQIRKETGSFPQPYGQNIYLLLDMKTISKDEMSELLKTALVLHRKLQNKKLIIKIINPTLRAYRIYKLYKFPNIDIHTDYFTTDYKKALLEDIKKFNIGLVMTNNKSFDKYKKEFFEIKKPIFKKGEELLKKCNNMTVILHKNNIKRIASAIFDISYQLEIKLNFLNADPENSHKDIVEYLKHLAKLFNFSNVEFSATKDNPIRKLNKENNICIIEALEKKPISKLKEILMPKIEYSYVLLSKHNQFLIPVIKEKNESQCPNT